MLWLSLINDGDLRYLHEELECLLEAKHGIPVSRHDRAFQPHISLFTSGTQEQMRIMYNRLKGQAFVQEIEISRFVVGSSGHEDTFYNI